jgi:hypothetical protein
MFAKTLSFMRTGNGTLPNSASFVRAKSYGTQFSNRVLEIPSGVTTKIGLALNTGMLVFGMRM